MTVSQRGDRGAAAPVRRLTPGRTVQLRGVVGFAVVANTVNHAAPEALPGWGHGPVGPNRGGFPPATLLLLGSGRFIPGVHRRPGRRSRRRGGWGTTLLTEPRRTAQTSACATTCRPAGQRRAAPVAPRARIGTSAPHWRSSDSRRRDRPDAVAHTQNEIRHSPGTARTPCHTETDWVSMFVDPHGRQ